MLEEHRIRCIHSTLQGSMCIKQCIQEDIGRIMDLIEGLIKGTRQP